MQPTRSDVHVTAPLTNISVAYMQGEDKFIAGAVFPDVPVKKQSDRYIVYDRGDFNRDEMEERAPATESAGSGYTLDNTPTYFARKWSLHKDIDDDTRANSDTVLSPDRDAAVFLSQKALIKREVLWAGNFFKSGVWANQAVGGAGITKWSDYTNSTPIPDIRGAITTVEENTGFTPNVLVLGKAVFDKLIDHPTLVDRVKYGQTGDSEAAIAKVNAQNLAAVWGLDKVVVASAIVNQAKKGAAEDSAFILGNNALLAYVPKAPGLQVPSAGYTFTWTGVFGAAANGVRMKRFRMEQLESDRVEIEMYMDQKQVAEDLGYFFSGII